MQDVVEDFTNWCSFNQKQGSKWNLIVEGMITELAGTAVIVVVIIRDKEG